MNSSIIINLIVFYQPISYLNLCTVRITDNPAIKCCKQCQLKWAQWTWWVWGHLEVPLSFTWEMSLDSNPKFKHNSANPLKSQTFLSQWWATKLRNSTTAAWYLQQFQHRSFSSPCFLCAANGGKKWFTQLTLYLWVLTRSFRLWYVVRK